jgi:hypothetical protein
VQRHAARVRGQNPSPLWGHHRDYVSSFKLVGAASRCWAAQDMKKFVAKASKAVNTRFHFAIH